MKPMNLDAMREATRLTREGRLSEAMALLQGAGPTPDGQAAPSHTGPTIDLTAGARPARKGGGTVGKDRLSDLASTLKNGLKGLNLGSLGGTQTAAVEIAPGASFTEFRHAGAAGSRSYKLYVPGGSTEGPRPLLVMLHGCTQSPDDFAVGTGMNALAERHGLIVAYPAQDRGANANGCWNWFQPADQRRGSGELAILAGIVAEIGEAQSVDRSRIFVAGLSAGGATAALLAAEYPEIFAAAGVHSGLPAGAASDMPSAFAAMRQGGAPVSADRIRVPTIVFHGDRDATVHSTNGDRIVTQAGGTKAASVEVRNGRSDDGVGFERSVYRDGSGRSFCEHWILHGAGHAWAGGSAAGTYTDPAGPDASAEMVRFFLAVGDGASA